MCHSDGGEIGQAGEDRIKQRIVSDIIGPPAEAIGQRAEEDPAQRAANKKHAEQHIACADSRCRPRPR